MNKLKFKYQHVIDLDIFCAHHDTTILVKVQQPFEHPKLPYRSKQYRCDICDESETIDEFKEAYLCPTCRDDE